jgi:hypothetical protein
MESEGKYHAQDQDLAKLASFVLSLVPLDPGSRYHIDQPAKARVIIACLFVDKPNSPLSLSLLHHVSPLPSIYQVGHAVRRSATPRSPGDGLTLWSRWWIGTPRYRGSRCRSACREFRSP